MKTSTTLGVPAVVLAALVVNCRASGVAPATLPPCIIQYTFDSAFQHDRRVVLYDTAGSYAELAVSGSSPLGTATTAPHRGSFAYVVDPQDPSHASIIYDGGGTGTLPNDELYFSSATGGAQSPGPIFAGGPRLFTVYPKQSSNGGVNFSNRCTLAANGTTISGFVVAPGGPRWMLIRATGTSLKNFGVSSPVSSPSFTLYDSSQAVVASPPTWSADPNLVTGYKTAFTLAGAFPLADGSDETVLFVPLNSGAYTALFKAASAGEILCEAYVLPY